MVSRRVRRRRRQVALIGVALLTLIVVLLTLGGGSRSTGSANSSPTEHATPTSSRAAKRLTPLSPQWRGNGRPVTISFGGDVHFEGVLGQRLATNPTTALGPSVASLMGGVNLSMADLDTALTNGTCPIPQHKSYVWYAPSSAINALQGGGIALVSMANSHGEDCGQPGLVMSLSEASSANYPVVGIGNNAAQAYAPYLFTTRGQRIAVLAASQLFAPGLQASWSATSSQPGVASALNQAALISAVKSARKTADTVVVYLNWGSEAKSCPNPSQPPLARALVKAGADIVVGAGTQVQAGAGYIGQALVDYGLGNLAFYDSAAPESTSGSLVVTVTGRHIDHFTWRPAVISGGIPTPLSGAASTNAVNQWASLRSCAGLSATPSTLATTSSRSKSKP